MDADIQQVLFDKHVIAAKVEELGQQIERDYKGKETIAVCILNGSCVFFVDLMRAVRLPITFDFMSISSYGNSRESSGVVQIIKDLDNNIEGKHVLIIEDIMDTGRTLAFLKGLLRARNPSSFRVCCLLDKPSRRVAPIQPDYCGFTIPDEFVVGYGLDFADRYRNLPYIGVLKPEVYV